MSGSVSSTIEYGEGYIAFENHHTKDFCPYRRGTNQQRRWEVGYEEAKDDAIEGTPAAQDGQSSLDNELLQAAVEETKYV